MTVRVPVDVMNPGQFFACCGLFEVAERIAPGTTAWFEADEFVLANETASNFSLAALFATTGAAQLEELVPTDATASPLAFHLPRPIRLDWWKDRKAGGATLKPWAGTMQGGRIATAMRQQLETAVAWAAGPFDYGAVVLNTEGKKVEPFYFDARRGSNALATDVGFSTDSLKFSTTAFPAVEFFCLVGLQRFRPALTSRIRTFEYSTWRAQLPIGTAALVVSGHVHHARREAFRFENAFRTDQRKHKAFSPASPITRKTT